MTLAWFCKKAHSSAAIAPFGVHPSQPGTSCCHGLFCLAKDRFRSWAANPCAPLSGEAGSPPLNVDRRGLYLWQRRRGMQSHQGLQTPLSLWLQSGRGSSNRSPVVRNILDNVAASHALNWCIQKENQLQGREIWRCPVYLERKRFFVLSMWGGLTINRRNKSLGKFREKRLKSCPGPLFFQYASKQRAQISRHHQAKIVAAPGAGNDVSGHLLDVLLANDWKVGLQAGIEWSTGEVPSSRKILAHRQAPPSVPCCHKIVNGVGQKGVVCAQEHASMLWMSASPN